jgi:CheY-like chemotaxis protein
MSDLLVGQCVLLVEDEFLIRMMIEQELADLGCRSVFTAATITRALDLLEAQPFDVALLDMNLRGEMSFPVADELVARGVPFAFSTGYDSNDLECSYPGRPVLRKPFQTSKLQEVLMALLPRSAERAYV